MLGELVAWCVDSLLRIGLIEPGTLIFAEDGPHDEHTVRQQVAHSFKRVRWVMVGEAG